MSYRTKTIGYVYIYLFMYIIIYSFLVDEVEQKYNKIKLSEWYNWNIVGSIKFIFHKRVFTVFIGWWWTPAREVVTALFFQHCVFERYGNRNRTILMQKPMTPATQNPTAVKYTSFWYKAGHFEHCRSVSGMHHWIVKSQLLDFWRLFMVNFGPFLSF